MSRTANARRRVTDAARRSSSARSRPSATPRRPRAAAGTPPPRPAGSGRPACGSRPARQLTPPARRSPDQRPPMSRSVNRSRYAAIPPSSTARRRQRRNRASIPTTRSDTTRGWRWRSAGVTCARSRISWRRSPGVTAFTAGARARPYANRRYERRNRPATRLARRRSDAGYRRAQTWQPRPRGGSARRCAHGHSRPTSPRLRPASSVRDVIAPARSSSASQRRPPDAHAAGDARSRRSARRP